MVNRLKHERFQSRFRPFFVSSFRLKRFLFLLLWKTDWILCALKVPVCFIRSACRMVEQLFVTGVSRQHPTISVTFWNRQSNIVTHITQWFQKIQDFLKSRALVADMGNPILISSFFILFGFIFLSTFTVILLYIWRSFWKFVWRMVKLSPVSFPLLLSLLSYHRVTLINMAEQDKWVLILWWQTVWKSAGALTEGVWGSGSWCGRRGKLTHCKQTHPGL